MIEEQIQLLLLEHFGVVPTRLVPAVDGRRSIVWEASLPDRELIVRAHEDPGAYSTTEKNLKILAGLGLPVPRVLASDLSAVRYSFAYLIHEKIPGRDLRHELAGMSLAQMTRLAEQVAGFQRIVGSLSEGSGYGWVGIGERGPFASWPDLLFNGNDTAPGLIDSEIAPTFQRRLRRLTEHLEPYFAQVRPTCFLDDITVKNVIVENGELRGLIDFDCVCYGDHLHWLGLTATGVVCDVSLRELFYVEELIRFLHLTPMQCTAARVYSAMISLGFVNRYAASETPEWRDRMLVAIEGWIDAAEVALLSQHPQLSAFSAAPEGGYSV